MTCNILYFSKIKKIPLKNWLYYKHLVIDCDIFPKNYLFLKNIETITWNSNYISWKNITSLKKIVNCKKVKNSIILIKNKRNKCVFELFFSTFDKIKTLFFISSNVPKSYFIRCLDGLKYLSLENLIIDLDFLKNEGNNVEIYKNLLLPQKNNLKLLIFKNKIKVFPNLLKIFHQFKKLNCLSLKLHKESDFTLFQFFECLNKLKKNIKYIFFYLDKIKNFNELIFKEIEYQKNKNLFKQILFNCDKLKNIKFFETLENDFIEYNKSILDNLRFCTNFPTFEKKLNLNFLYPLLNNCEKKDLTFKILKPLIQSNQKIKIKKIFENYLMDKVFFQIIFDSIDSLEDLFYFISNLKPSKDLIFKSLIFKICQITILNIDNSKFFEKINDFLSKLHFLEDNFQFKNYSTHQYVYFNWNVFYNVLFQKKTIIPNKTNFQNLEKKPLLLIFQFLQNDIDKLSFSMINHHCRNLYKNNLLFDRIPYFYWC